MFLKDIIVNTKTVEVDFPGLEGFTVTLSAISRELSRQLREKSEVSKIDSKLRVPVTELDEEKFVQLFTEAAIKDWKGLKFKYMSDLLLVDESKIEDLDACVPFSKENAIELIKHSQIFDTWINEQVFSIDRFRD